MDTAKLYERICALVPCSHTEFISCAEYARDELCALYGKEYATFGVTVPLEKVGGEYGVRDEFASAIFDDIMYRLTNDERYKTDFLAHAENAYRTVWRESSRGRRIHGEVW